MEQNIPVDRADLAVIYVLGILCHHLTVVAVVCVFVVPRSVDQWCSGICNASVCCCCSLSLSLFFLFFLSFLFFLFFLSFLSLSPGYSLSLSHSFPPFSKPAKWMAVAESTQASKPTIARSQAIGRHRTHSTQQTTSITRLTSSTCLGCPSHSPFSFTYFLGAIIQLDFFHSSYINNCFYLCACNCKH